MMLTYHNKEDGATEELYNWACHLDPRVSCYSLCIVGGIRFHIRDFDIQRRTQNNKILMLKIDGDYDIEYCDILTDIIRLRYGLICLPI